MLATRAPDRGRGNSRFSVLKLNRRLRLRGIRATDSAWTHNRAPVVLLLRF
jgi:hypothetical protein